EPGLLGEFLELEPVGDDELGLLGLEGLLTEFLLDSQLDEPLLLVDPQVAPGVQVMDEMDPAAERAAGNVEEAVGGFQALLHHEVELELADLLPESPHVFAMADPADAFLSLGLQIRLGAGFGRRAADQALELAQHGVGPPDEVGSRTP